MAPSDKPLVTGILALDCQTVVPEVARIEPVTDKLYIPGSVVLPIDTPPDA